MMRRQEVNGPVGTSPEKCNIVDAKAFIGVEGSTAASVKARTSRPPGCVTLARAQGIGGNLGDPRASRMGQRDASEGIGRGGAREQATGTGPVSAVMGPAGNKTAVSSPTEGPDLVETRKGDRSTFQRGGGVGASRSTEEAGTVAKAATPRREGDSKGPPREAGVINSVRLGTTFPAHRG